jgi:hypothetical protein
MKNVHSEAFPEPYNCAFRIYSHDIIHDQSALTPFLLSLRYFIPGTMYQKDYILRMIEMLGDLIAAIMGLIKKGDYEKASWQLERIYYDMLKEDAAFFRAIPEAELTSKLLQVHHYTNGHLEILAELFHTEAGLELAKGNRTGCLEYFQKALILFEFIDQEQKTYSPDRMNRIAVIKDNMKKLRVT